MSPCSVVVCGSAGGGAADDESEPTLLGCVQVGESYSAAREFREGPSCELEAGCADEFRADGGTPDAIEVLGFGVSGGGAAASVVVDSGGAVPQLKRMSLPDPTVDATRVGARGGMCDGRRPGVNSSTTAPAFHRSPAPCTGLGIGTAPVMADASSDASGDTRFGQFTADGAASAISRVGGVENVDVTILAAERRSASLKASELGSKAAQSGSVGTDPSSLLRVGAVLPMLACSATPEPIRKWAAARVSCLRPVALPSTMLFSATRSWRMVANPSDTPLFNARVMPIV